MQGLNATILEDTNTEREEIQEQLINSRNIWKKLHW